jgi:leucine dehydrogenase
MSLKASAAGLHQGGGKSVVLCDDPDQPRSDALLRAIGRAIEDLGGRYIGAEDVGATPHDMSVISQETRWVTGIEVQGSSGDPSPFTAWGVLHGMRAVLAELDGEPSPARRRIVVQGAGHVGSHLVRLLVEAGALVAAADTHTDRVDALARKLGVESLAPERVLDETCDVLAPCALGSVFDARTIPRLRCRAVCGAANNQLADEAADDALQKRGILYAPDFVVSAGGIINIYEEFTGYDRRRALENTARIEETTRKVFALAREWQLPPGRAAERMARRRIAEEGGGRHWRPGDPTAWTHGEPLRSLRPEPARPGAASPGAR